MAVRAGEAIRNCVQFVPAQYDVVVGAWRWRWRERSCLSVKIAGIRRRLSSYQSDGRRYLRRRLDLSYRPPTLTAASTLSSSPHHPPTTLCARTRQSLTARPSTSLVLHDGRLINQPAKHNIHPSRRHTSKSRARLLLPENSSILFLSSLIFRVYRRRVPGSTCLAPRPPSYRRPLLIFSSLARGFFHPPPPHLPYHTSDHGIRSFSTTTVSVGNSRSVWSGCWSSENNYCYQILRYANPQVPVSTSPLSQLWGGGAGLAALYRFEKFRRLGAHLNRTKCVWALINSQLF